MQDTKVSNTIAILDLCSEIFNYPTIESIHKVKELGRLVDNEELKNFSLSLKAVEIEYIKLFSLNSTLNKTVPNASWWIDGKIMGKSFVEINNIYNRNGCFVDMKNINLPQDHISLMISFVAILLEEEKFEEALLFCNKYFKWLNEFELSLNESSDISFYPLCIGILKQQLTALEVS